MRLLRLQRPSNQIASLSSHPAFRFASVLPAKLLASRERGSRASAALNSEREMRSTGRDPASVALRFATHPETGFAVTDSKQRTGNLSNRYTLGDAVCARSCGRHGWRRSGGAFFGTEGAEKAFAFSSPVLISLLQLILPGWRLSATLASPESLPVASSKARASIPREQNRNPFEVRHGR